MGVVHLWEVLKEIKKEVTIDEIKGKTLAVDLAAWICESEGVKSLKTRVGRPYLRNLFFRVNAVTKAGIHLVFVLDGKAPDVKLKTIANRLASSRSPKKTTSGVRSRLNAKLKECCVLLDSLGLPWIKAEGEAEALCSTLNKIGLVDGVISNDGDAFLYGAETVYRNFTVDKNGFIEKYTRDDIKEKLMFSRNDLIALGLILGCDYCPKGVPGIGPSQAARLLSSFGDENPLMVFSMWRTTGESFNSNDFTQKPTHCSNCGHEGLKKDHHLKGCKSCGDSCLKEKSGHQRVPCLCNWHRSEDKRKKYTLEEKIKAAALCDPEFPDQRIVAEFMKTQNYIHTETNGSVDPSSNIKVLKKRFKKESPTLDTACKYLMLKLEWTLPYAFSKVLPLLTDYIVANKVLTTPNQQVMLESVIKTRVKDHVPSLEVKWKLLNKELHRSLPDDIDVSTIESEEKMRLAFPDVVETFYECLKQKKEKKKAIAELRRTERKKSKAAAKKTEDPSSMKITDFFKAVKVRNEVKDIPESQNSPEQYDSAQSKGGDNIVELEYRMQSLSVISANPTAQDSLESDLGKRQVPARIETNQDNEKKLSSHTYENSTTSCVEINGEVNRGSGKGPIIIFSSDSEDEVTDGDDHFSRTPLTAADLPPKSEECHSATMAQYSEQNDFPSYSGDLTFSGDINFSLGCSLLNSPDEKNAIPIKKSSATSGSKFFVKTSSLDNPTTSKLNFTDHAEDTVSSTLSDESLKSPLKNDVETIESRSCDSPVFMTLMERLNAKRKQVN